MVITNQLTSELPSSNTTLPDEELKLAISLGQYLNALHTTTLLNEHVKSQLFDSVLGEVREQLPGAADYAALCFVLAKETDNA
ncbi:hypothetical protein JCM19233_4927 [Vibrio astriarenae]|nr:hypothetical protein JCM19233_4927 [Vibrio sp. C7]